MLNEIFNTTVILVGRIFRITYGSVVNTSNFNKPESENYKITDISFAYFANGNVAISKDL